MQNPPHIADDGRSGPFLRRPHNIFPDGSRAYDARCPACSVAYDNGEVTEEEVMRSYRERHRPRA